MNAPFTVQKSRYQKIDTRYKIQINILHDYSGKFQNINKCVILKQLILHKLKRELNLFGESCFKIRQIISEFKK